MNTPCKVWTGAVYANGYGKRKIAGRTVSVHRHAYEQVHGPIPEGMQIDHLCRVRACYEVSHLEAVTAQENVRRAHAVQTHCKRNHEFTPENTRLTSTGARRCRACVRAEWHNRKVAA